MEGVTTIATLPSYSSHNASIPTAVHFCTFCEKPFINESSRQRHLRYCVGRTRKRPRSCQACYAAKVKCSFVEPCSRCTKKGVECVYIGTGTKRRSTSRTTTVAPTGPVVPQWMQESDGDPLIESTAATNHLLDDSGVSYSNDNGHPGVDLSTQTFLFNDSLSFDELLEIETYHVSQTRPVSSAAVVPYTEPARDLPGWCSWASGGFTLSLVMVDPTTIVESNTRANVYARRPYAQHNGNLVIQSLRSFPTMMLRRDTFPWFIHPHSERLSRPAKTALPEALSNCMGISQMFVSRTPETRALLWSNIRAEYCRFMNEKHYMTRSELLAGAQASMIYLIMCMIDQSPESEKTSLEILITLEDLYYLFKRMCADGEVHSELSSPSSNWEDWIFAESRRRFALLWFLVACVKSVKLGVTCDPKNSFRHLPLPGLKSLWEADSQSRWAKEYEASHILQACGLVTLGDLIDAQEAAYSPSNVQKMDKWNAGVDNLGSLLNLVGTMV